ncbi:uncharacterized protein EDB91DRAFT_1044702, partial [Suillus paluster]|uniref:uncharacterized protein n=1 Tax=Suillus paluster TaxID=48578 RepID=UPI001B86871F
MIARCRAKCWIVQLKEENQNLHVETNQRGIKGHIIIYPQQPDGVATVLPPTVDDIVTPICVIFVGSTPPSHAWLQEKAKPLIARREKVRAALVWLKQHNCSYKNIVIDHARLNAMETETIMPFHVNHVLPDIGKDILTSRYDAQTDHIMVEDLTDVDGHASPNELRAAAVRHVKNKSGGYIQIPHDPQPVNEFFNPDLFPLIYPTLFPYGVGGFEDCLCREPLSMKRHVKHL